MSNFWKEQFDKYPRAEGVDFVGWGFNPITPSNKCIIQSNTKDEMCNGHCVMYPRSNYYFWFKDENGYKKYFGPKSNVPAENLPVKVYQVSRTPGKSHERLFRERRDAEEFIAFTEMEDIFNTFCYYYIFCESDYDFAMNIAFGGHYKAWSIEEKMLY